MLYLYPFRPEYGCVESPLISANPTSTFELSCIPLIEDTAPHSHKQISGEVFWDMHPG